MKQVTDVIRIKLGAHLLSELELCEYGAHEDALARRAAGTPEPDDDLTVVEVIERGTRTQLVVRTNREADRLFYAVCSGTFQIDHYRCACRIADILRPYADPATVRRWGAPYGG